MLYQIDVNPDVAAGAVRDMIREQLPDEDLRAFAWSLFAGVRENRAALDSRISTAAENWTLARMCADRPQWLSGSARSSCSIPRRRTAW